MHHRMKINMIALCLMAAGFIVAPVVFADEAAISESTWVDLDPNKVPQEMADPEGMTRWDFTLVQASAERQVVVRTSLDPVGLARIDRRGELEDSLVYVGSDGDVSARRWLLPHSDSQLLATSATTPIRLQRIGEDVVDELWIQTRRVGIGWIHLPSGPREVVLQRALIQVKQPGAGYRPQQLVHRWIDPREGVVAFVSGPTDGQRRLAVHEAGLVSQSSQRGPALRIFADQIDPALYTRINYGFDRGPGTTVASLTPAAHTTIGDLANATSWDFSGNDFSVATDEVASTVGAITPAETCNSGSCGFPGAGRKLGREDRNFDDPPNTNHILSVTEREDRGSDTTIWLRAGVVNEEEAGALGTGESRFCYDQAGTPEVPLWQFTHQDSPTDPYYFQNGDSWTHPPFTCDNAFFSHQCTVSCGLFCPIWVSSCAGHSGTQNHAVINEGPVTLPSGHTFQTLVIKQVTDFCAYIGSGCGLAVDEIRTVIYLWIAPHLGTVVRLQSAQLAPDETSFTTLGETDIKFGLFPPRSVSVDNSTDSTIELSWDPGLDTRRIDGYKIYWDTDSGAASNYAFDSDANPGQVSIVGTSATISGLASGTDYFVTVTSLSDYTNPATLVLQTYESKIYPTTIPGTPTPVPVEVTGTTTSPSCTPTTEATGLTATSLGGGSIQLCWDPSADPCTDGYTIYGANAPSIAGNFSQLVPDTGLTTCHTFSPTESYFIVAPKGTGGVGLWGHFGI